MQNQESHREERHDKIFFSDVLVINKLFESLKHFVYCKSIQSSRYLIKYFHHHASQKHVNWICKSQLYNRYYVIQNKLFTNRYTPKEIKRALHPQKTDFQLSAIDKTFLFYIKRATNCIAKVFKHYNVEVHKLVAHFPRNFYKIYTGNMKRGVSQIKRKKKLGCSRLLNGDKSGLPYEQNK